jgi:hypothetical protein
VLQYIPAQNINSEQLKQESQVPPSISSIIDALSDDELDNLTLSIVDILTKNLKKDLFTRNELLKRLLSRYKLKTKDRYPIYEGEGLNDLPTEQLTSG